MMRLHTVFFASGSKGKEVRADGCGSYLARGYWFRDEKGLNGPFPNPRVAERALANVGLVERTTMTDDYWKAMDRRFGRRI